jgi:hypothetical protein
MFKMEQRVKQSREKEGLYKEDLVEATVQVEA